MKLSDRQKEKHKNCEISKYVDTRFIGSTEAMWRIFKFRLYGSTTSVVRLPVRLPNSDDPNVTDNKENHNLLDAYFKLVKRDRLATHLLYEEIPLYFRYCKTKRQWLRYARNHWFNKKAVRIHMATPFEGISCDNNFLIVSV